MLQRSQLAALHLLSPVTHPSIMSKQTTVTILVLRGCFCLSPWRKRIRVRNVSQYIKCKVGVCVSSVVSYCFHVSSEFKYKAPISIIHMNLTCRFRMSLSSALCWSPSCVAERLFFTRYDRAFTRLHVTSAALSESSHTRVPVTWRKGGLEQEAGAAGVGDLGLTAGPPALSRLFSVGPSPESTSPFSSPSSF